MDGLLYSAIILLSFATIPIAKCQLESFKPVTENVSFKALFRLQLIADRELIYMSETFEQYHRQLEASNIWQIKVRNGDGRKTTKRFIYNSKSRRDFELVGHGEDGPGELYLEENGGSSSYESPFSSAPGQFKAAVPETVNVLPEASSLDSILLSPSAGELDLDSFMHKHCLDKIRAELHYVRGLSRLLQLIECRRQEFKLDAALSSSSLWTRGFRKRVYQAELGEADWMAQVGSNRISMTVSLEDREEAATETGGGLPTGLASVPISMSLDYKSRSSGVETRMIINVFQFELLELPNEHLSESWSSESVFLLPLGSGLSAKIAPGESRENRKPEVGTQDETLLEFSFRASLTGTEFVGGPYEPDPIELRLAFDGPSRMLAREITTADRSVSLGTRWLRRKSRTVFDAKAGLKYHIESSGDALEVEKPDDSPTGTSEEKPWVGCATSALAKREAEQLLREGDFFDLQKSTFLGMAMVRGIACQVYERRLWRVPFWLGVREMTLGPGGQIYLTLYEASDQKGSGKLLRAQVAALAANGTLESRYNLEIYSFHWSGSAIQADYEDFTERCLFDIGQECLYSDASLRHLSMEFLLSSSKFDSYLTTLKLEKEPAARDRIISSALEEAFDVSRDQQVNLETTFTWDSSKNESSLRLSVKLDLWELPKSNFVADFVAWAEDLGAKSFAQPTSWLTGSSRVSLEECQWLASHSLYARDAQVADYNRKPEEAGQMFMFCPRTFHCVLGDSSWWPALGGAGGKSQLEIDSVLRTLKPAEDEANRKRCSIYSVKLMKTAGKLNANGLSPFDSIARAQPAELAQIPIKLKLAQDKLIPLQTVKVKTSGPSRPLETSGQIPGLGYVRPTDRQPLRVSSGAKCGQLCFLEHDCESYSICHDDQASFECLLTAANLTEPAQLRKLRDLARTGSGTSKLSLELTNLGLTQLELRVSPSCSLHAKSHWEMFQSRDVAKLVLVPKVDTLLFAETVHECAKFCGDRAKVIRAMRLLAGGKLAEPIDWPEGCLSFEFSREFSFCSMKPEFRINQALATKTIDGNVSVSSPATGRLLDAWRQASARIQAKAASLMRFAEVDSYELNFQQLFVGHPGERLMLAASAAAADDGDKWKSEPLQRNVPGAGEQQCARFCLLWDKCKSFDIYISGQAEHEPDLIGCHLNAASYDELAGTNSSFKLEKPSETPAEPGNWWHFEPSELSLYLMGLVPESTAGGSGRLFLERPPTSSRAGWSGAFPEATLTAQDEPFQTDWSRAAAADRERAGHGLWLMLAMVLVMLALVMVCLAARTTGRPAAWSRRRRQSIDRRQLLSVEPSKVGY